MDDIKKFNDDADKMDKDNIGMAWYKFLIYVSLIMGAIGNVVAGLRYLTGSSYISVSSGQLTAEEVYINYGNLLKAVDIIYGLFLIGIGVLAMILRHKLAKFKPDAPKFVCIFYSLNVVIPFIYAVIVAMIILKPISIGTIYSLVIGLIFLFLNIKYFKKRKHLFI